MTSERTETPTGRHWRAGLARLQLRSTWALCRAADRSWGEH